MPENKKKTISNETKARHLAAEFSDDPFRNGDSAANDILKLRAALQKIVREAGPEVKNEALKLLATTDTLIDLAKKTGQAAQNAGNIAALSQRVSALAQQVGSLESQLAGYKLRYAAEAAKPIEAFEAKWATRTFVRAPEICLQSPIENWDDYLDACTGKNVKKGEELVCLSKAIAAVKMKVENKPFSLEEADKLARAILHSKAFKEAFGEDGRVAEAYLKNRNISQAILRMNEVQRHTLNALKTEQDEKYKEFNEFLDKHAALRLGYELTLKKDAEKGTNAAHEMVEQYHTSLKDNDDMIQAVIMTKLLKEAEPVLRAAKKGATPAEALKQEAAVPQPEPPVLKPEQQS